VEFLREIGAIAGLAAFLGLAVLALLYFSQARDLRRLRENASFLVETPDGQDAAAGEAPAASATRAREKAAVAAPPAGANQQQIEAFRRAELARQAAERRQRFERRRGDDRGPAGEAGGRFGRPDATAIAVIVVGALLLAAGIGFGITQLVDDDGGGEAGSGIEPQDVEVKVLNSTAVTGLAGQYTRQLKQKGFDASPFTTTIPLEVSEVMYEGRAQQQAAGEVARALKIRKIGPLDDDYRPDAAGAPVVVVLGEDKAQGA
jgi:hypothetical protein